MKTKLLLFTLCSVFFISCAALKTANFTSDNIRPGMTKEEVVSKFGKPDRESFNKLDDSIILETLYYVYFETIGTVTYYDYILDFKNGALVSMRQEPQVQPSVKTITIQKE